MGQKVSPVAIRLGNYQKWQQRWYSERGTFSQTYNFTEKIEIFFKQYLSNYPYGKRTGRKQLFLVDCKHYKNKNSSLYRFLFFYKFRLLQNSSSLDYKTQNAKQTQQVWRQTRAAMRKIKFKAVGIKNIKNKYNNKKYQKQLKLW